MEIIEWISLPATVSREVNFAYFFIVLAITLTVVGIAVYTKNKRAIKMFLYAMIIWAFIESFGLVTGMRIYSKDTILVFFFVAFIEDPGWVCLGFMIAEQLFKKLKIINKQQPQIPN